LSLPRIRRANSKKDNSEKSNFKKQFIKSLKHKNILAISNVEDKKRGLRRIDTMQTDITEEKIVENGENKILSSQDALSTSIEDS
jgi:hypothetical protein